MRTFTIAFIGGTIGTVFTSMLVIAWTGPASPPPNGNVAAPINTGTTDQIKDGGLGVNALAVFGNAILSGPNITYLNFGGVAQEPGYGIRDNAGTMEFKNSGGIWAALDTGSSTSHGGQKFTTSGTFLVPPNVTSVKVTLVGGGGSGGTGSCAGGGGGGGMVIGTTAVTPQTSMPVTVGIGGASGNDGGDSSFGGLMAGAGKAGEPGPSCGASRDYSRQPGAGGAGGTALDGYMNFPGSAGGESISTLSGCGLGGACQVSYSHGPGGASVVPFYSVEPSLIPDWGKGGRGGESGKSGVVLIEW